LRHRAVESFWQGYDRLPIKIRTLADENYGLLRDDASHSSLRFKEVKSDLWSVRIGLHYRALAYLDPDGFTWFCIGIHAEYDRLIK
jgi:hypothetical protein